MLHDAGGRVTESLPPERLAPVKASVGMLTDSIRKLG